MYSNEVKYKTATRFPFVLNPDVTWRGQEAKLILHYNDGFSLLASQMSGPEAGQERLLWKFPFDKLKMSADDSQRLLWVDFGGDDGEKVRTTSALCWEMFGDDCLLLSKFPHKSSNM